MENISRYLSNEDTATSMYLSFDAESTMSTACYKTLDATTDISTLSTIDLDKSNIDFKITDKNNTLEAGSDSQIKSPLKTVKKMEMLAEKKTHTPLRALPKNIMKEYIALCSTPSKEQLLKTVDVTRGSDATRCVDLGLAFLGVEDEKPAYFPPPNCVVHNDENKENAQPEIEEVSTLSTCSSVEVTTTVIERKMSSMMCSVTEEEGFIEEVNMVKSTETVVSPVNEKEKSTITAEKDLIQYKEESPEEMVEENEGCVELSLGVTPKDEVENIQCMATITESPEKSTENAAVAMGMEKTKIIKEARTIGKTKITAPSSNLRRSICEPNLQTNKPSRILNSGDIKRKSFLPTSKKSHLAINAENEIPLLMSRMLKISNVSMEMDETDKKLDDGSVRNDHKKTLTNENRRSVVPPTKIRSLLNPSATGDKRPFSFTQRMSVVVKTTLNSPARKITRRSLIGGVTTSLPRRSVVPQKTVAMDFSNVKKTEIPTRKTMLPKTSAAVSLNTKTNAQRHSLMPSTTKMAEKAKTSGGVVNKQEIVYTCNFCKEKFRIKSLLEAHKRSHETDNITPPFVKKPTATQQTSSNSLLGHANQCKYCDKKFALIKALHIHLLQNCSKIPPSEKRKLQYTDLNHVQKAQLPNVFNNHQYSGSSTASSDNATPRNAQKCTLNTINIPKSTLETTEVKDRAAILDDNNCALTQASAQKGKKLSAHAGVYRTPSKSVPCHLCKTTFKSILDYTNHNLTVHGKDDRGKEN